MKKRICTLLVLTMALGLSACGGAPAPVKPTPGTPVATTPSQGHYPVTVTTYSYTGAPIETTYEKAPERVLCVYQGCIETMLALGLEEHVVASYGLDNEVKDAWKTAFAQMNYQTAVFSPDKETVTLLEPDLIFTWGSLFGEKKLGDVNLWHEKGVSTYMNTNTRPGGHARSLENEYTDILNIGKIFDVEDRAQALVDEMRAQVADTLTAVAGKEPVRVAVVEPYETRTTNYGADTLAGDMVKQLGGVLAKPAGGDLGKEDLLAGDPDVIFVIYMAYEGDDPEAVRATQLSRIAGDPALQSLRAVQNDRVRLIMLGDVYASGPRTIDGLRGLAAGIHTE